MDQMDPARFPVPPGIAARARQLADGRLTPVEPRQASTVVLLRDGPRGVEAYVLRRRRTMAFAPGMYVFPGGSVDPRDGEATPAWAGPSVASWAVRLGFAADGGAGMGGTDADGPEAQALARASVCAVVRELFEETGVLLAGPASDAVVSDTTGADWERDRQSLLGREESVGEMLVRRSLVIRSDLLAACGHWVTPEVEVRRYDTRFYVAALPSGQRTRDVSGEADRVAWIRPADAAAAVEAGEMEMLPPTAVTLAALEPFATVAEAFAAVGTWPIRRIMPTVGLDGDEARWVVPA